MSPKFLKLYLLILASLFFYSARSQNDIITTTKGERIICSITKEDSAKVYFKVGGSVSSIEASIERNQIISIQYAPKNNPQVPALMAVPGQIQRDDYVAPTASAVASSSVKTEGSNKKYNSLSFCVGLSSPVGKFKNEKLDSNEIGPGMNGVMVGLGFTHLFKNNFGVSLNGFFANNELNTAPILAKYQSNTDSTWSAEKAYWKSFGLSVGLLYYKEFGDLSFFGKVNAGYLSLKYPELKLIMHSDNYLNFQTVTTDAISFGGGIGASYKLSEGLHTTFEVSYLQATCKYNEVLIIGEEPSTPQPKKISMTRRNVIQSYQNIFFSLGLNYWF